MPSERRIASYQSPPISEAGAARVVAADQLDALDIGEVVGEQAALQPHGDLVLALERGRAVERLRGLLGVPGDLRLLALVQRMRVREQQAERAEAVAAAVHERRRVERVRFSEQRLVHTRERRPQIRVLADHDRRAGVERQRRRLRDHEVERVRARGERSLGRGGELQAVMILGVQRDDAERAREGIGETGHEAVGDLGAERRAAEDAAEVAALARPRALALGRAAAAQEDEADQEEHDRRRRRDERELEEEPAAGVCEEHRTRLVDHDRPARDGDTV